MGTEIERKFLVRGDEWRKSPFVTLRQGYLYRSPTSVVRVRTDGTRGYLTVKGSAGSGITRSEYEYPIPLSDADQMLDRLCDKPLIEKSRFLVDYLGTRWEVDEFQGENTGLVIAEVELTSETQEFAKPAWIGREVTNDPRYLNANLVKHPYSEWDNRSHSVASK